MKAFYAILDDQGVVKQLNRKYPCLYTSLEKAKTDNSFNQVIISVHESQYDLAYCAIDHKYPKLTHPYA